MFGSLSYSFPGILTIVTLVSHLSTPQQAALHLHTPFCPPGKGPIPPQSTTPTTNTQRPFLLDSVLCCPYLESFFLMNPHGKSFLLDSLQLHRCYIKDQVNKAPNTMAGIQQALNTCLERRKGSKERRKERKDGRTDGHQDKGSQQHPHPCSRGPHSLPEVQSLQSPLLVSPLSSWRVPSSSLLLFPLNLDLEPRRPTQPFLPCHPRSWSLCGGEKTR